MTNYDAEPPKKDHPDFSTGELLALFEGGDRGAGMHLAAVMSEKYPIFYCDSSSPFGVKVVPGIIFDGNRYSIYSS